MQTRTQEQALYTINVEGATLEALREFTTGIVAHCPEGESDEGLITATAEQVEKLRELLRVRRITPAGDGIYVGRTGQWYAVKNGEVSQSGHWTSPREVLQSFGEIASSAVESPVVVAGGHTSAAERDPVCGMTLKPGQEEASITYQDHTYHFCSAECRDLFLKNPTQYIQ